MGAGTSKPVSNDDDEEALDAATLNLRLMDAVVSERIPMDSEANTQMVQRFVESNPVSLSQKQRLEWWSTELDGVPRIKSVHDRAAAWRVLGPSILHYIATKNPAATLVLRDAAALDLKVTSALVSNVMHARAWAVMGHSSEICTRECPRTRVPPNVVMLCPVPPGAVAFGELLCAPPLTAAMRQDSAAGLIRGAWRACGGVLSAGGILRVYFPGELMPDLMFSFRPNDDDPFVNKFGMYALPMPALLTSAPPCIFSRPKLPTETTFPADVTRGTVLRDADGRTPEDADLVFDPEAPPRDTRTEYPLSMLVQALAKQRASQMHVVWVFGCRSECAPAACGAVHALQVPESPRVDALAVRGIRVGAEEARVEPAARRRVGGRARRASDAAQLEKF